LKDSLVAKNKIIPVDLESGDECQELNEPVTVLHLLFEIEDTGTGLSDEAKSKLFQPFNQDVHQRGGNSTGLGLFSLARRLDALGGKYGCLNRKDNQRGCRFWFSFPYQPDTSIIFFNDESDKIKPPSIPMAVLSSEELPQFIPSRSIRKKSLRVLVADDSTSILKVTTLLLKRLGCDVDNALNGRESLEMTIKQYENISPYDVVLTDIQMPIMDGYEYAKAIRMIESQYNQENNSNSRHQLIIGVSANSDDRTVSTAVEMGIDALLSKPFSTQSFLELMDQYVHE